MLAAAVLHELNNPLHALGLLLDELAANESDASDAHRSDLVDRARAQTERALKHLQALRSMRGLGRARVRAHRARSGHRGRRERHALARRGGRARGPDRLRAAVQASADPAYVRTIVENLVDNSLHALRGGGRRERHRQRRERGWARGRPRLRRRAAARRRRARDAVRAAPEHEDARSRARPPHRPRARPGDARGALVRGGRSQSVSVSSCRCGREREGDGASRRGRARHARAPRAGDRARRVALRRRQRCARRRWQRAKGAGFIDVVVTDVVLGKDDRAGLRLLAELRARESTRRWSSSPRTPTSRR